jgi:hypothetical protein
VTELLPSNIFLTISCHVLHICNARDFCATLYHKRTLDCLHILQASPRSRVTKQLFFKHLGGRRRADRQVQFYWGATVGVSSMIGGCGGQTDKTLLLVFQKLLRKTQRYYHKTKLVAWSPSSSTDNLVSLLAMTSLRVIQL